MKWDWSIDWLAIFFFDSLNHAVIFRVRLIDIEMEITSNIHVFNSKSSSNTNTRWICLYMCHGPEVLASCVDIQCNQIDF